MAVGDSVKILQGPDHIEPGPIKVRVIWQHPESRLSIERVWPENIDAIPRPWRRSYGMALGGFEAGLYEELGELRGQPADARLLSTLRALFAREQDIIFKLCGVRIETEIAIDVHRGPPPLTPEQMACAHTSHNLDGTCRNCGVRVLGVHPRGW